MLVALAQLGSLLAEFQWDPQIRGIVIVAISVIILPGSVYLLLATNVGARLGFLLAIAGLSGWMVLMGMLWWLNAQGMKGRDPGWDPQEIILAAPGRSALPQLEGLPVDLTQPPTDGWRRMEPGEPVLGDATAAADKILAPDTGGGGHGEGPSGPPKFQPPFNAPTEYRQIAAFQKGGKDDGKWFAIRNHNFYKISEWWNPIGWFRNPPHYVVIVVQRLGPDLTPNDLTDVPEVDQSQPPVTLTLVRDRGSVRFPPVMITLSSLLIFLVTCWALHRRDKEIMQARAGGAAGGRARPATA